MYQIEIELSVSLCKKLDLITSFVDQIFMERLTWTNYTCPYDYRFPGECSEKCPYGTDRLYEVLNALCLIEV